jgi:plastocyanin
MRISALAPIALAAALLLTVGGCAATADVSTGDESSQSSSDDEGVDDTEATEETEESGMSDLVPVFTDAPATPGPEMVLSAAGFEPSSLTVASGDIVTFTSNDGGIYGLIVNQLDSVTVTDSLPEYYQFNDAGTYYLIEDISGATATITVE